MRSDRIRIVLLPLILAAGCSSISDSISSPFESSSASSASSSRSSSPDRAESYRDEVRDYTAAYVKSSADVAAFQRGLAGIASRHGVSNWEADDNTYVAIGQGLKKAGVTSTDFEVWKSNLSDGDPGKAAAMQKGYEQ